LKWQPVVVTIANLTRAEKQSSDSLAAIREKLEPLDVKFTNEYVTGQTTHVVATKRNVPTVLQGIINGNYVVTRDYIDAIAKAATEEPSPHGEGEPKAPLEKDFSGSWPDAMQFVPPVANEPVKRDASYLAPNPERTEIFYGYTFVFCMKAQYEQVQPVINAGSGKAVLYEGFQEGRTDPHDFVAFVKNVAGEKGTGELDHSDAGKRVVVVRITTKNPEWDAHFVQESDSQLNQRSIEQNEFLDTILTVNPAGLRKRLEGEIDLTSTARKPSQRPANKARSPDKMPTEKAATAPSKPEPPSQARKPVKRPVTQSRFKGFDDFEDELEQEPEPEPTRARESLSRIAEDTPMDDVNQQPASVSSRSTRLHLNNNQRKRPTPEPDNVDVMDSILPAATAMKRRRLNQTESTPYTQPPTQDKPVRRPKQDHEVDVLEEAKKRRGKEEEKAREDAENLKEAMNDMEIQGPANLVSVEDMEVTRSQSASISRTSKTSSARWDERWNGRPNFKRFRRKGEDRPARGQRVIVPVEETKKNDFGIGEEYWLESSSKQKEREKSQRETQQQSQTLRTEEGVNEDEDDTQFRRRVPRLQSTQNNNDDEDMQIVDESTHNTAVSAAQQPTRQTRGTDTQTQNSRKRPVPDPVREVPVRKKTRPAWTRDKSEDEEEDDALAFPRVRRGVRKRQ
jgi:hypothetical protein